MHTTEYSALYVSKRKQQQQNTIDHLNLLPVLDSVYHYDHLSILLQIGE